MFRVPPPLHCFLYVLLAGPQVLPVPCDLMGKADNIMWDVADPHVFVIAEQQVLHIMLYMPVSISGVRARPGCA